MKVKIYVSEFKYYIDELNSFAIPLIIQFVASYLIGLTDQAIIGRISVEAYGVIGVVNSFNYMLLGVVGSVSIILNIRAGDALERKDGDTFRREFMSSILLGCFIGVLLFLGTHLSKKLILGTLYGFEGILLSTGLDFFTIMSPYGLLQLLIFIFGQYFKVKNNTKWLLVGSFLASVLNLILDCLFVLGVMGFPRFGVKGAAASTMIAMLLNLMILIVKSKADIRFRLGLLSQYASLAKKHVYESLPLAGQEILEGSVFVVAINSIITRIGAVELSTYLILQQLLKFLFVPMNMYSSAVLTLVSQNKKNIVERRRYPWVGCCLSMFFYCLISVIFLVFRLLIPQIITNNADVIYQSSGLILFTVLTHGMMPACTIYKSALTSIGEGKFILYKTAMVNAGILMCAILFTLVFKMGLKGILLCNFLNSLCLFGVYYLKYKVLIKENG